MSAFGTERTHIPTREHQWHISCDNIALPLPTTKPLTLQSALVEDSTRSEARYSVIVSLHVPEDRCRSADAGTE
ncbi:hypothetical protein [Enterobacter ludwigii]|jgi:hypothetical protein|uniref:hypothetical protein n=1 Tax=Enterobacter ludwigii TaxID=299767 RepID=UPI0021507E2D|nr:hypothetical protein [Enterobacter ludwigii]